MNKRVKVFGPATVANVACGFDVLGFPLEGLGDIVSVERNNKKRIIIETITGDEGKLSKDIKKNTCGVSIEAYMNHYKINEGVSIYLEKKLPLGSGLGSSSASAAASLVGVNMLFEKTNDIRNLIPFAMESEKMASGSAHADIVAPALLGGITLIRSYKPLDILSIPTPSDLICITISPKISINTKEARKLLPKNITLKEATQQWGNLAATILGFCKKDYTILKNSLEDVLIEKYRSKLIPNFSQIKKSALENGAIACSISGSGPTIFALSNKKDIALKIAQAMELVYQKNKMSYKIHISKINKKGATIIS